MLVTSPPTFLDSAIPMLANPILIPMYADPISWGIALLAVWAEVTVARAMLRRFGLTDVRFARPLYVINLSTWFAFLVAVDHWLVWPDADGIPALAALEAAVVVVETILIFQACRGRCFSSRTDWRPLGVRQVAMVSLLANATSIAASLLGFLLLGLLFG